jgi:hypothetical protein
MLGFTVWYQLQGTHSRTVVQNSMFLVRKASGNGRNKSHFLTKTTAAVHVHYSRPHGWSLKRPSIFVFPSMQYEEELWCWKNRYRNFVLLHVLIAQQFENVVYVKRQAFQRYQSPWIRFRFQGNVVKRNRKQCEYIRPLVQAKAKEKENWGGGIFFLVFVDCLQPKWLDLLRFRLSETLGSHT